jgi:alkylation response protein AidB-like acyl-CoA dehydrogenase
VLGVSDEHVALHESVRRWVAANCPPSVPRALLDGDGGAGGAHPPFWDQLAAQGWLGLHVPESVGGEGYSVLELGVVIEELGRAVAPGPFVATVLAACVIDRCAADTARRALLPKITDGLLTAAVAYSCLPVEVEAAAGSLHLTGTWPAVPGAALADVFVLPVRTAGGDEWCIVDRSDCTVSLRVSVDVTRPVADVVVDGCDVAADRRFTDGGTDGQLTVAEWAAVLLAAECSGVAAWCVETAAEHARVREQFGRPIGQFQGVKHRCADMLCALEQARAVAWDALRAAAADDADAPFAAAVAAAIAPEAAFRVAKDCIQVLGGIGFTWEHDAHLYLKRAMATRAQAGRAAAWRRRVVDLARAGQRRSVAVDLPDDAGPLRAHVDTFLADLRTHDKSEWRRLMADAGYITPHWPRPWGRGAGPLEQLVIDDAFRAAHVRRPHLQVGAWALPTLVAHGTPEQQARWIPATLRGELSWCQLFSEPGAGSDLASLSTKASRVDGGWALAGQKVWTSMATTADWAICLARTNPSAAKHDGITCFMVDMRADGIDVRPLRELTGDAMFNEVFLSDVFVPDDCVVGGVDRGWLAARTTLENERVSMGSGASFGFGVEAALGLVAGDDDVALDEVGALVVTAHSLAVLGLRLTMRVLSGAEPGPESSVRKLLGVEHDQRVQEVGLGLLGSAASAADGDVATWVSGFLFNRCLTIAGGTSEIQRNVIAERLLGLPKDP